MSWLLYLFSVLDFGVVFIILEIIFEVVVEMIGFFSNLVLVEVEFEFICWLFLIFVGMGLNLRLFLLLGLVIFEIGMVFLMVEIYLFWVVMYKKMIERVNILEIIYWVDEGFGLEWWSLFFGICICYCDIWIVFCNLIVVLNWWNLYL